VAPSAIIPANDRDRQTLETIEAKGLIMEILLFNSQLKQVFSDERKDAQHIFTAHVLEIAGSFAVPNARHHQAARSLGGKHIVNGGGSGAWRC